MWNTPWMWPRSRVTWVPLLTLWGPPAPGDPTLVHAGLGPVRGHPNFCIWWFKVCGGGIDLVLIKKVPFRKSVSQTSKCFLSPNEGRLQKRCERKPALHHSGRSARHQEGHTGCQTGQRGKWVVKTLPVHHALRAGSTRRRPPRTCCPFGFSLIQVEYRAKHRKEGSHGLSMLGRPDIEMAKKAAKLSSQVTHVGKQSL